VSPGELARASAKLATRKRRRGAASGVRASRQGQDLQGTQPHAPDSAAAEPPPAADDFGEALTAGFARAVRAAVAKAHEAGLAVPGRRDGEAVEFQPDGQVRAIDEDGVWSPRDWRHRR